jgi:hypothetical protein
MGSIAAAGEQLDGLEERQSDHICVGAADPADQRGGAALDRIAAGLAALLAAAEISRYLGLAQPLEGDLAVDPAGGKSTVGARQRDGAMDAVAAPGQQLEARPRARCVFGLGQDATAASDDSVGSENVRAEVTRDDGPCFFRRKAHGVSRRQLAGAWGFVDIGGVDSIGDKANLSQQFEAARRRGGEHEARRRHKTLIPADAARRSA